MRQVRRGSFSCAVERARRGCKDWERSMTERVQDSSACAAGDRQPTHRAGRRRPLIADGLARVRMRRSATAPLGPPPRGRGGEGR
eukprot:scaffold5143_cov119-Isochrysis_galbana.AAC.18